jgi:hypothetical protein
VLQKQQTLNHPLRRVRSLSCDYVDVTDQVVFKGIQESGDDLCCAPLPGRICHRCSLRFSGFASSCASCLDPGSEGGDACNDLICNSLQGCAPEAFRYHAASRGPSRLQLSLALSKALSCKEYPEIAEIQVLPPFPCQPRAPYCTSFCPVSEV